MARSRVASLHATTSHLRTPEDRMAARIQSKFRSWSGLRIYRFFRDLIKFRGTGDPKTLLRTINPSEAALFDGGTAVHLRFRLGGSSFPPTLYYKIFTSSPVADIGSFAPRDYTKSAIDPEEFHDRSRMGQGSFPKTMRGTVRVGDTNFAANAVVGDEGMQGWYERTENNGWRAVTVRATDELGSDSVESRPSKTYNT
ncbi:hypothetical protein TeGR_g10403, partial [Tetraparma gracilis]